MSTMTGLEYGALVTKEANECLLDSAYHKSESTSLFAQIASEDNDFASKKMAILSKAVSDAKDPVVRQKAQNDLSTYQGTSASLVQTNKGTADIGSNEFSDAQNAAEDMTLQKALIHMAGCISQTINGM